MKKNHQVMSTDEIQFEFCKAVNDPKRPQAAIDSHRQLFNESFYAKLKRESSFKKPVK